MLQMPMPRAKMGVCFSSLGLGMLRGLALGVGPQSIGAQMALGMGMQMALGMGMRRGLALALLMLQSVLAQTMALAEAAISGAVAGPEAQRASPLRT